MDLSMLSGPIIGAVIGYGTNWIAIKMLFRPLKPVKIGKFTLPFTPGIIPRRKEKLAEAIGNSVGNHLFTKSDIEKMLLSEEVENLVVNAVFAFLGKEETIKDRLLSAVDEEEYFEVRESLKIAITEKIQNGLLDAQIGEMISKEGGQVIRDKVKGSMLRMLVTDGLIDSIVGPMGMEIEKYIREHGQERIMPVVENEVSSLENASMKDLMENFGLNQEKLEVVMRSIYRNVILEQVNRFLEKLDISKVVEEKVNEMEVAELEQLLMSIMKKELGAIVNLGALIGLILGTLNVFL